jgi:hypothetical protein
MKFHVDLEAGLCRRRRPGCGEAGVWKPFYLGFVCVNCLTLDQEDVRAGRNPPGDGGVGKLFREAED